ncbi:hypothetical protein QJQ45_013370 [Haematococcus lacustris]|nr:hypothetical protein QJQ45_013370 [Haematococcus lacustris]
MLKTRDDYGPVRYRYVLAKFAAFVTLLVSLYEEPDKPKQAMEYIKTALGSPTPAEHAAVIAERDSLKKQLAEAQKRIEELESQSQLQGSSQHHPALPALMHLPGLSILTRPATNPVTSPAVEQQPIIHTTEEQDEQTMPPSMPKQQQDWATARSIAAAVLQQIQQVPALLRLLRSQPDSKVTLQLELSTREVELCSAPQRDAHAFASSIPGSMSMHSCFFPAAGIQVEWSETACACAQCMTPAPRGVCMRPSITKPFVAMPMFDQKRDDKHWDDECLTLLCSFAPDSVKQLCTLGKKLSVKMLNEYCKAVGLYVPANTLRADLRYMVLEHLNGQAEWD